MTDTNEPTVPGTPPAAPPPPVGQPIGQPAYAQAGDPAAPSAPTRSTGKFVAGLIMTILGGLWTLGGLANLAIAASAFADDPAYAVGRLIGGLVLPIAVLVIGIVLLRSSKPKVQ